MDLTEAFKEKGTEVFYVYRLAYNIVRPEGTLKVPAMYQPNIVNNETPKPTSWALGLNHFPFLDGEYTDTFIGHFVDRFADREIGYDSLAKFERALGRKLNLRATIWEQRFRTTMRDMPLDDVDVVTSSENEATSSDTSESESSKTSTRTGSESTTDDSGSTVNRNTTVGEKSSEDTSSTESARDATSRFPSTMVGGDSRFLSEAVDRNSNQSGQASTERDSTEVGSETVSGTGSSERDSNESTTEGGSDSSSASSTTSGSSSTSEKGRRQSVAALVEEQRAALVNVIEEILDELEPLFLGHFNTWYTNGIHPYDLGASS